MSGLSCTLVSSGDIYLGDFVMLEKNLKVIGQFTNEVGSDED